jgi:hypothetical protein
MPLLDPTTLFLNAHLDSVEEAERCFGIVEKGLLKSPKDCLLLGCKAALLLILKGELGLEKHEFVFRRNALQMASDALKSASPHAVLKIHLMNGIAWARLPFSDPDLEFALSFLQPLEEAADVSKITTPLVLEGYVALSVLYEEQNDAVRSAACYQKASGIDFQSAANSYGRWHKWHHPSG